MRPTVRKSLSEQMARQLAKDLGAKMRRDNANRVLIVTLGDKRQQFWQGSWPEVVVWLRKQIPPANEKGKRRKV